MLECVINVSEGHEGAALDAIIAAAGGSLLDVHSDRHHNRSVLTLVGEDAARDVTRVQSRVPRVRDRDARARPDPRAVSALWPAA